MTETTEQASPSTQANKANKAKVTVPNDTDIVIIRDFEAPPRLVYRAWTTPELVERWWSGDRGVVISAEIDLRVGGAWRYVMTTCADAGGYEVGFHGEFRAIEPETRLVTTEIFEGFPDEVSTVSTTFDPAGKGRTRLTQVCSYSSREVRDTVLETGMEIGMQEAMDHLEEVAVSLG